MESHTPKYGDPKRSPTAHVEPDSVEDALTTRVEEVERKLQNQKIEYTTKIADLEKKLKETMVALAPGRQVGFSQSTDSERSPPHLDLAQPASPFFPQFIFPQTPLKKFKKRFDDPFGVEIEVEIHILRDIGKLIICILFCVFAIFISCVSMVIGHERVPESEPLPDIFLSNTPVIPWAFMASELIIVTLSCLFISLLMVHRWRLVILCRFFIIMGCILIMRSATIFCTTLSVPSPHLDCKAETHTTFEARWEKIIDIFSGLGASVAGVQTCGDYMFSGHTSVATTLALFVVEYGPSDWTNLQIIVYSLNIFAAFFVLAGHEHYSIDVILAYYISSRLFSSYHYFAMVQSSMRSNVEKSWFYNARKLPFYHYVEDDHLGICPNQYEWPHHGFARFAGEIKEFFVKNRGTTAKLKKR